jgi:hypothetical protein
MKTPVDHHRTTPLAAAVAPEDLRNGDHVAVLTEVVEVPSCCWCDLPGHPPEEPIRLRLMSRDSGLPLRIQSICLPFVLVRTPCGWSESIDIRRVQLVRVTRAYARTAWKQARKERDQRRREQA